MTDTKERQERRRALPVSALIHGLEALTPRIGADGRELGDRAALAALRRGLGKTPGEAPEMFPVLLPLLGDAPLFAREEWVAYHIASLFALHPLSWTEAERGRWQSNLGVSMRRLADQSESQGPERRFRALLNSDITELPHHLRGVISLLRTAKSPVPVDWSQLTRDLLRWSHPERHVQRAWAQAFWGGSASAAVDSATG